MEKWSFQRIRELMTHIALRGMAANELGRARISMMVRSISSNTRPDTLVQDRTLQLGFSLATHGGSIHWVMCGRRLIDKSFFTLMQHWSGAVSGLLMRRGWPLALMLCADQVPIESTHS